MDCGGSVNSECGVWDGRGCALVCPLRVEFPFFFFEAAFYLIPCESFQPENFAGGRILLTTLTAQLYLAI